MRDRRCFFPGRPYITVNISVEVICSEPNRIAFNFCNSKSLSMRGCHLEGTSTAVFEPDFMIGGCCESVMGDYFFSSFVDESAMRDEFYSIPYLITIGNFFDWNQSFTLRKH